MKSTRSAAVLCAVLLIVGGSLFLFFQPQEADQPQQSVGAAPVTVPKPNPPPRAAPAPNPTAEATARYNSIVAKAPAALKEFFHRQAVVLLAGYQPNEDDLNYFKQEIARVSDSEKLEILKYLPRSLFLQGKFDDLILALEKKYRPESGEFASTNGAYSEIPYLVARLGPQGCKLMLSLLPDFEVWDYKHPPSNLSTNEARVAHATGGYVGVVTAALGKYGNEEIRQTLHQMLLDPNQANEAKRILLGGLSRSPELSDAEFLFKHRGDFSQELQETLLSTVTQISGNLYQIPKDIDARLTTSPEDAPAAFRYGKLTTYREVPLPEDPAQWPTVCEKYKADHQKMIDLAKSYGWTYDGGFHPPGEK